MEEVIDIRRSCMTCRFSDSCPDVLGAMVKLLWRWYPTEAREIAESDTDKYSGLVLKAQFLFIALGNLCPKFAERGDHALN